jgi:hypothetical protein
MVVMMVEVARVGGQAAGAGRQVLGRAGASSNKSSRQRRARPTTTTKFGEGSEWATSGAADAS